ncbi:MAG: DUF554 domain-containing protein [Clostridiales bacterium]|mgnify:CR=1 FL=1|nr:DUF554 domain-containing protein [Clostridiales bacterium]
MLGTITNTACILTGSVAGSLIRKGIKKEYSGALYNAMGLAAAGLGINAVVQNMPKSNYPVLFIASLAAGSLLGTILRLDERFNSLADKFGKRDGREPDEKKESTPGAPEAKIQPEKANLGKGLSTAVLLFCIGTLSILGPVNSALYGDNTYLFTNATLDLVTSTVLASTYGIGIALAAPILFLWQGAIYLLTLFLGGFITTDMMTEISIVGGFLIASSGLSILNIKDCKTLNMLPSLFVPVIFLVVKGMI